MVSNHNPYSMSRLIEDDALASAKSIKPIENFLISGWNEHLRF